MSDIVQRVVFEKVGVDGINDAITQLTANYKKAEEAQKGVLAGLGDQAKEAEAAIAGTVAQTDAAATSLARWETINKSAGKELKSTVDRVKIFGVEIGTVRSRVEQARAKVASFGKTSSAAGKAAAAGGKAAAGGFSIARVGAIALQVALGPIGLILAAVAAAVGVFTVAAQRSQPVIDAIGQATAAVSAVFNVFLDRVAGVGEAFLSFFSGDFAGGFDQIKASVSGINEELRTEIQLSLELERNAQRRAKEEINLDIKRAASLNKLKELNLVIEDVTKTDAERLAAATKSEETLAGLQRETIRLREEAIAEQLGLTEVTDETRQKILELGRSGIVFESLGQQANDLSVVFEKFGPTKNTLENAEELKNLFVDYQNELASQTEIETTSQNKRNQIIREAEQKRLKYIQERRKAEEDLGNFQKQLQEQLTQLAVDESTGEARIELERKVAQSQIDELERVARAKFKEARQTFNLEAEFAELRAGVDRDATKQSSEFRASEATKELEARRDAQLAEIELLTISANESLNLEEFKASERARITRESLKEQRKIAAAEFGEGSAEVLKIDVEIQGAETAAVNAVTTAQKRVTDEALKGIEQRKVLRLAENDLITESADKELSTEQFKQREKNRILVDALLDRRKVLTAQLGANAPEVKLIDLQIKGLQKQIDAVGDVDLTPLQKIKEAIGKAFNLDDAQTDLLISQATGAFNSIVTGLEAIYERQLIENDKLLSQIDDRVDKITDALETELEKQEQGLANNADVLQTRLDEENARREKAEQDRLEIEKKAARQRIIIESAQQVSALGLAAAQLLASEASKGLIGLVLAAAGVATIFSIVAKAKAQAAQLSDAPTFRGGGFAEGILAGPSHEGGGINAIYNTPQGTRVINVEGGEHIMPLNKTKRYAPALEAMRTDKIGRMSDTEVLTLLGRNPTVGISSRPIQKQPTNNGLSEKQVSRIVEAIKGQLQPVAVGPEDKVVFVESTGTVPTIKRGKIK